ncbi:MAG: ComF family protein [Faecousia sp.]
MIFRFLTELLFPPKCVLCGAVLKNGETDLCRACRVDAPEYPNRKIKLQFLDSFVAVWYYEGNVRRSLLRYKFHNKRSYSLSYGRILAMKLLEESPEGFDMLTWVPVSRLRRLRRGYDQVELLADAVGKELGIPPVSTLKKIRNNRPQSRLKSAEARRANVLGAYRTVEAVSVKGKRVLLLDDILTTGATAGECARMLLSAGAKEVHCAAVAAARK